ncbi:MAG: Flagellar biosynthesis protein FlhA [Chlamydiae bacterium]|nr:Flagellar biosynthesis protein FlhA [Chlamydiota bacterium]
MKGDFLSQFREMNRHSEALIAVGVMGLLALLLIPLPPFLLDVFLCFSLVFSLMTLLLTLYVEKALEFNSFPTLLLFLTLYRLGLNIASTRMILTQGEGGDMIETFGEFVTRGSVGVGLVLFLLLSIINFVVVTKGSGRIAEVAARFVLEALPGKQMAIDSELSSGLLSQSEAKEARNQIAQEADFYGAMDGASKFVRGDAIASLVITGVNILGGLAVGFFVKGYGWERALSLYTRLAIGDGLVTQIPALLISVGAGVMMTRASRGSVGQSLTKQVFSHGKVLLFSGLILLVLSLIPGMPRLVMLPMGGVFLYFGGRRVWKKPSSEEQTVQETSTLVSPVEVLLGFEGVEFAKPLHEKLGEIRKQVTKQLGAILPSISIADSVELPPSGWAIHIKGFKVAGGREVSLPLLVQELEKVLKHHAHELLNRQIVAEWIQEVRVCDSAVVEELIPKKLSLGQVTRVLQNLLREGVPIQDRVTILELLADHGQGEKSDLNEITEQVRLGLSRGICERVFGKTRQGHVILLDPKVEQMVEVASGKMRPATIDKLARSLLEIEAKATKRGVYPVLLTKGSSRIEVKRMIEKHLPHLPVLAYREVADDVELETIGMISQEVLL